MGSNYFLNYPPWLHPILGSGAVRIAIEALDCHSLCPAVLQLSGRRIGVITLMK